MNSLASVIFIHIVILNSRSPIAGIICLICLIFLFFETAFGICLGCKFYPMFFKEKAQYCPGEVCEAKLKQDIQKTSPAQIFVVLGFAVYIFIIAFAFNNNFSKQPYDLFGLDSTEQSK